MNKIMYAVLVALLCVCAVHAGEEKMPLPTKEHEWLKQLTGEWETETEIFMEPGKPSIKTKGTESNRMIGGFWSLGEVKGNFMGAPFTGILTVGYDAERKTYVGTWVDSMNAKLWTYTGSVDAAGKILTLDAEGPCPMEPGKTLKFKETIEIKDADNKVFTSTVEKDGKWQTILVANYKRKK